jgi:hypothetical protein
MHDSVHYLDVMRLAVILGWVVGLLTSALSVYLFINIDTVDAWLTRRFGSTLTLVALLLVAVVILGAAGKSLWEERSSARPEKVRR